MSTARTKSAWGEQELRDVCDIVMGQSPSGDTYNSQGKGSPLLNGPTEFGLTTPKAVQWTTAPAKYCEAGDVLLCVQGLRLAVRTLRIASIA